MFKRHRVQAAFGALALGSVLILPLAADALTASGPMIVTTSVAASCTTSATTADLGTWLYTAASTASSTITVTCTQGAAVSSVGIDNGLYAVATVRQMRGAGTANIAYGVYQDATFATAWTNAAWPALGTYTAVVAPAVFTAYVKAPAGTNVIAGTYTDTVGITVTYS
jgi:spore coat protein U domain-containing protein, fimbrial subunit CupE1/2/3/6